MVDRAESSARREAWWLWGVATLLTVVGFAVALRYAGAPPPERVRLGTGEAGGGYAAAGAVLGAALSAAGITPVPIESAGSADNLARLRAGEIDVGLVQGGLAAPDEPGLVGVASLYLEPLWVFGREPIDQLEDLAGRRVALGAPGSGSRALSERLLELAGVSMAALQVDDRGPADAGSALLDGALDAVVLVAAPRSETVRRLLVADGIEVADLVRAAGICRHLPFLQTARIPRGAIDLGSDLPARDVHTVAAAATMVAREELHPAVVALLVEAAKAHYGGRGVLEEAGAFPSARLLDVAPSEAGLRALEHGPSWLFRVLPFQVAAAVDRLKILALPLLTLLLPLARLAPPLYRWRVRRRILTYYKRVRALEADLRAAGADRARLAAAAKELDELDSELADVAVPLGYADELYHLRLHLRMVRTDLTEARGRWQRWATAE